MISRQEFILFPSAVYPTGAAVVSKELNTKHATKGVFHLNTTVANGTSLDVSIEWYEPASGNWLTLFSFTQVVGVNAQTVWWGFPGDAEHLPGRLRAKYTVVGTSFTFSLGGEVV